MTPTVKKPVTPSIVLIPVPLRAVIPSRLNSNSRKSSGSVCTLFAGFPTSAVGHKVGHHMSRGKLLTGCCFMVLFLGCVFVAKSP